MATLDRLAAPILRRDTPVMSVVATSANSTYKIEQTLLDSGASQNCINRRVVEKLGLAMVSNSPAHSNSQQQVAMSCATPTEQA
ncbi:hypothetical protein AC578_3057 [Pseudocercospora eumusae]|uniref:Peptidase A2 domain-containing protein n=1 Tax=Pseudocercospora eumusae TaxID=321146 RepID=A0A139H9Q1_9PEZI|nr:hypothetical protein AC578_3057 [Pseudocercospora eumusae]